MASIRHPSHASRWLAWGLLGAALYAGAGCSRAYYRKQADAEVYCLVDSGSRDPRWPLEDYTIDVAPASRLYDPFCPDGPPIPPDDPASHRLMQCVDGKRGWPCWHANGDAPGVENNSWQAFLPRDERGQIVMDLEGAVHLGRMHSRHYQEQLEELYLSALDVTFERYRLDAQFFAGNDTFFTVNDRGPGGAEQTILNTDTGVSVSKLYPAGGELLVGFANSLMWQFSGNDSFMDMTVFNFSFIQPLLRAGGRDVVMERLTLAERTLLANIRAMEQYRKGFYTEVAIGRDAGQGPNRRGGLQGGAGLEGFSGVGAGGFGRIGNVTSGGGNGGFGGGGAGAAQASGFLGLLQDKQQIENQQANVAALRDTRDRLVALYEAQRTNMLQAVQAEQALTDAESRLLTAQATYETTLDAFKVNLGLPPCLTVAIEDDMLDQFELLHPELNAFPKQVEQAIRDLMPPTGAGPNNGSRTHPSGSRDPQLYRAALELARKLLADFDGTWLKRADDNLKLVDGAVQTLEKSQDRRRKQLRELTRIEAARRKEANSELTDAQIQARAKRDLETRLATLKKHQAYIVDSLVKPKQMLSAKSRPATFEPDEHDPLPMMRSKLAPVVAKALERLKSPPLRMEPPSEEEVRFYDDMDAAFNGVWELLHRLQEQAAKLQLIYARARLEAIDLAPTDLDDCQALQIASQNRLDWMNARASLVDTWRLIEFNADNLESDLDLVVEGDLETTDVTGSRVESGELRVGFEFDAPLARLEERNLYRQSLIEYQQARRGYLAFVDGVSLTLRTTIRTLELNQTNFEIRRQAIWSAIDQVDQAQSRLYEEPPAVGASTAAGGDTLGPTAARDLLSALSDLLNAQNDFLSVWVNYQLQRIQLDLDLGTMQLDPWGIWIDPGTIGAGCAAPTDSGDDADTEKAETIPAGEDVGPAEDGPYLKLGPPAGADEEEAPLPNPSLTAPIGRLQIPDGSRRAVQTAVRVPVWSDSDPPPAPPAPADGHGSSWSVRRAGKRE